VRRLHWCALALVMGCSQAGPPPSGPALPVGPITHQGRWLTDAEGRVVLMHGVNMVNKNPPYYPSAEGFSDADATWLAANGFLVVRVGILATGLMPTPGVVDMGYLQNIATTVQDLASHGVYSLIDLHQDGWGPVTGSDGFPAWMTLTGDASNEIDAGFPFYYEASPALQQAFQSFWDNAPGPGDAGLEDDYAAMFTAVATTFANQPFVLGYDLFNEPWPGTTWSSCLDSGGCPMLDQSELGQAYARATTAIRAAGDEHLVFGEPFSPFNFGSLTAIPVPGADPNAGMAFHVYPLAPNEASEVVGNAVAWSMGSGGALLNTEWGASVAPAVLQPAETALDTAFVSWIFWSFCCELVSSLSQAPGGSNLVASTASLLIEPYPLAVAGTPQMLTIDPTMETLSFTWSTARVGGGSFATGAVTTFEVPASIYPMGYTATATGGWVTSAACAPLLTVAAMPDATTVSVNVVAGGNCP